MSSIGGFICAKESIIEYFRYNMRSQMFAKALPITITIGARKRLELLRTRPELKNKLWEIANALQTGFKNAGFDIGATDSPVTPVFMKGNLAEATNLTFDLRENFNIFCSIVIYPVVPKDVIMLRIIPTAAHTLEDVEYTIETFKKCKDKMDAGAYKSEQLAAVEVDTKK
jgi:glycine C-acetyltransferase